MTQGKLNVIAMLTLLLLSWNALEQKALAGSTFFSFGPAAMLQDRLDLTDEQATGVQKVFISSRQAMGEMLTDNGLEREQMQVLGQEMAVFQQQILEELAAILDLEQLQILRRELSDNGPMELMQMPEEDQVIHIQYTLGLSEEKAGEVAALFVQGVSIRDDLLQRSRVSLELMMDVRRQMMEQREKLKIRLAALLSDEQLEGFATFINLMSQKNSGYGLPIMNQGGQL